MDRVDEAMHAIERQEFLPPTQRERAALDVPLGIGHGATCSQPTTVATMLRLLGARPGHAVLDVGSGSGRTAALLDHLVTPGGTVVGVEIMEKGRGIARVPRFARIVGMAVRRAGTGCVRGHRRVGQGGGIRPATCTAACTVVRWPMRRIGRGVGRVRRVRGVAREIIL